MPQHEFVGASLKKMVFKFKGRTQTKASPMLSLSMFGNSGSSSMKAPADVRKEAVTFLGLLRHNEDHLVQRTKLLLKKDRQLVRGMFTAQIDEWTPLHACTLRGARKLVKMAMKAGVSPDLAMGSPEGLPGRCTALHLAAYRGDVSIIQLLLQNSASINIRDSTNRTPLYYAASRNNTFAARKLIKYGAEVSDLTHEQRVYYHEDIERRPLTLLCIPVHITGSSSGR